MTRTAGRLHYERGASIPETAIVIGVLLALILGIMDFGRAMYTYAFIAQITREGARWATVRGSQCALLDNCNATSAQIQTYVRGLSEGLTTPSNINVTATWPSTSCPAGSSGNAPGCAVSVNTTYQYKFTLIPFLASLPLNISSTSQMVISQ
ncbi:MAG TPA: TadE/TadG family type IV pilus assembly protein [Candidatus Binatia bacterium]|nr:TadE/TadG family type IV pilus assembly protein [Candidatus Binatia bacterium]